MDGIGRDLDRVVVEGGGQDLEREPRRDPVHAFVDARGVLVFLHAARPRVHFAQALAVVDAHLGIEIRVLVLPQASAGEQSVAGAHGALASSEVRISFS